MMLRIGKREWSGRRNHINREYSPRQTSTSVDTTSSLKSAKTYRCVSIRRKLPRMNGGTGSRDTSQTPTLLLMKSSPNITAFGSWSGHSESVRAIWRCVRCSTSQKGESKLTSVSVSSHTKSIRNLNESSNSVE